MTVPAQQSGWRRLHHPPLLGSLLALTMLAPVGVLFTQHWGILGDQKAFASQESDGVEYLAALNAVTLALTDAQSATVSEERVPHQALAEAVAATADVNQRLGEQLRVDDRWSELRTRIEQVSGADYAGPREAYDAYREATQLLEDLYTKVRETSGLVQDPDTDVYYLQDGAAEELPEAIIAVGRLVDLVHIARAGPDDEQVSENAEISVARVAVTSPVDDLTVDLHAALDSTESRTLSVNVLTEFEEFLRHQDVLLASVPADGRVAGVDLDRVAEVHQSLRDSAAALLAVMVDEIDSLVATRLDTLAGQQRHALLAVAAAGLLAAGIVGIGLAGMLGRARRTPAAATQPHPPSQAGGPPGPPATPRGALEPTGAR